MFTKYTNNFVFPNFTLFNLSFRECFSLNYVIEDVDCPVEQDSLFFFRFSSQNAVLLTHL